MQVSDSQYFISEIFQSIQGEGNFAGVNSLFIRFHFCNLTCNWCDSKYTWLEKSGLFNEYSAEKLTTLITRSKPYHIIFTGGEPGLYRLDKLYVPDKKFHVETNGMVLPTEKIDIRLSDGTHIWRLPMKFEIIEKFNWVVSPKLGNSYQILDENKFAYWVDKPFVIYKFIIRSVDDLDEVTQLVNKYKIKESLVYVGLEGISLHSQLQPELVDAIIERGYNFSPRLHILLWGNKRGK